MEEGKISVIVPIYKVENYLNRCVESIRKQTYRNLEIILVDDGSPDACGEMCDRYAQEDSRIRVIHKENGGLSDARNAGIEVAATAAAITSGFILLLFVFIVMFLPFSAFIFSLTEPAMRTGSHSAVLSGAKLCDQLSFFFIFIAPFCQIFSKLFSRA